MGLGFPQKRLTVNLAPADLTKEGSHYDLAIAIGLLAEMEVIPKEELNNYIILGELSLDGGINSVSGVPVSYTHLDVYKRQESALTKIADEHVKLDPRHVVLYGIRSFEEGEHELLKSLGVRIFFADEIKERGQRDCLKEAFGILKSAKKGYGVTIDLDFFDPEYAPAVGLSLIHI